MTASAAETLFETHKAQLDGALSAIRSRGYWSAFPESPSKRVYGETAAADGLAAFEAMKGAPFELSGHPGAGMRVGGEVSPYGPALGVSYPAATVDAVLAAATAALPAWRDAGVKARTGVCLEILKRINAQSFTFAHTVMHTTGQSFVMAFQAGGPHAQDRGLEAIAYAYDAMAATPEHVRWEKPQGKNPPLVIDKYFKTVPRGVAAVIGVSTFPTWNGFPGLFASLVTGNPVVVKPHPAAILPLALTVRIARGVLAEAGFDPNLVTLLVDDADDPIAKDLCTRPEVRIVDFTGGGAFGNWLEENCPQAQVYTEKSGVNAVVIDDFADLKGMARNLSYTFSLYSGQMCTTPQNVFIPKSGIKTADGVMSFDAVAAALAASVDKFLSDPDRAFAVLGAIQSKATLDRVEKAAALGRTVRRSAALTHPDFPDAVVRTPAMIALDAEADRETYGAECFGPVTFLIATEDTGDSLARLRETVAEGGAITAALYADDAAVIERARAVCEEVGVALSVNLTGGLFVNQSAAFSDFHATGANPAANAALTDAAFVANRFRVIETRIPVDEEPAETAA
ncbi:MAG: phenylacetic acid degradation protein PaaN [Alphaproteobacteria bacterium]|nr:phenylacetic acid degradation protein PaaN [Alphaproteobacteria bacterium]